MYSVSCSVSSVQFSRSVVSNPLQPHEAQHARPPCPSPTPGAHSDSRPSSQSCHPAISSSVIPFSSCLQSFFFYFIFKLYITVLDLPNIKMNPPQVYISLSQHQRLFQWISSSHQVAKVLEFQLQHQTSQRTLRTDFLSDGLVRSPCSPRDSQESSLTQFKSINSLVLSFLYVPTLTSIHDYWKNHNFD